MNCPVSVGLPAHCMFLPVLRWLDKNTCEKDYLTHLWNTWREWQHYYTPNTLLNLTTLLLPSIALLDPITLLKPYYASITLLHPITRLLQPYYNITLHYTRITLLNPITHLLHYYTAKPYYTPLHS